MDNSPRIRRLIHTRAVGALLAFDVSIVFLSAAIIVFYAVYDSRSLIHREPLLIWIPFAIATLYMIALALTAGLVAIRTAIRGQREQWLNSLRVLVALAVIMLMLLAISRASAATVYLVPIAALLYLVLPALAQLSIGQRSGSRLLAVGAWIDYAMTIALLVFALLFPRFGMDPHEVYDIYIPPQFSAAIFTLGAGTLSGVAAGIVCAVDARLAGRRRWSNSFQIAVAAGLLGPIALLTQTHYPPIIPLPATLEVTLAILAAASYLALPVMVLIYLRKPSLPASTIGMPHVSTSL